MGAVLDVPMSAVEGQELRGGGTFRRETGQAVDDLVADLAGAPLDDPPLNAEDLLYAGPGEVVVQGGGGGQAALLDPTVPRVPDRARGEGAVDGGAVNTVAMSCSSWGWLPFATMT